METYEIQFNDRDLDNYPEKSKIGKITYSVIRRAIQIVYKNHFDDLCTLINLEHYSIQGYWLLTVEVEANNLQIFRQLLQDYKGGNMSHYHCL